jgi:hypothetical protein
MIVASLVLLAATPVPPIESVNERPPFGRAIATASSEPNAPRLTGVVTTKDGPIVSLKDSATGLASWVSVGGSFAGWTLESVSDDLRSASIRKDGKVTSVSLSRPGSQGTNPYVPTAPVRQEQVQPRPTSPPPPVETIQRQRLHVPQR